MKLLTLLITCLCVFTGYGQSTLRPNIYFKNMNYYNAAAGAADTAAKYDLSIYGKQKLVDNDEVWKKPMSLFVNYIGKLKKVPGFYSVGYINDRYSFYDRNTVYAGYGYQWRFSGTNRLSVGARAIVNFDHVNWRKLPQIENKTTSSLYFTPDLDLGIQYQVKGFTLGISTKNIISTSEYVDGEMLLENQREFYSNISYAFNIKQKITIAPYVLLYKERASGIDMGVYLSFFDRVNVSYLFRLKEFRNVYSLGVNVFKGLYIGVAADHSSIYSDVNLDFMIGYKF